MLETSIPVFNSFNDDGHGWLQVPLVLILRLGIEDQISKYSYLSLDGQFVYLEEDLDAVIFHNAMSSYEYKNIYQNGRSPIRNYPSYDIEYINKYADVIMNAWG